MLYILAVADRGLISHAQAFPTRKAAEKGLVQYLRKNEGYRSADDMDRVRRWLEEHDERLSVEITEQTDSVGGSDSMAVLRHIYDLLYLDLNKDGEFYNAEKARDADTLTAIADIVRPLFPKPATPAAEAAEDELTPKDRAEFVRRIERVSPYDEGLDAEGKMVCPSDFITDLLTDVRHYCDARGVDFAACDRSAYRHYANERQDGAGSPETKRPVLKTGHDGRR